jgi:hypothetical protein
MFRSNSADYPTWEAPMFKIAMLTKTPKCNVSLHRWFRHQMTRDLVEEEVGKCVFLSRDPQVLRCGLIDMPRTASTTTTSILVAGVQMPH